MTGEGGIDEAVVEQKRGGGRVAGVDLFRGALVVLVVLGHFAELTRRDHFLTWFGAGFRMPLFIALTGYLFNLDRARRLSIPALLAKYYDRLILPWGVALAVTLIATGTFDWLSPMSAIVRPPYHLWFVPVMMAFILAVRVFQLSADAALALAIPASITAMGVLGVGHDALATAAWLPDRRFFIYPIYFAMGLWVARRDVAPTDATPFALASLAGFAWWSWLYRHPSLPSEAAAELLLCLPLIALFPLLRHVRFGLRWLEAIGRDSLFFYLWHPLAFALWALPGMAGLSLLVPSALSLLIAWRAIRRAPALACVLGVRPARLPSAADYPKLPDAASAGEAMT